jgi:hypothetical protein
MDDPDGSEPDRVEALIAAGDFDGARRTAETALAADPRQAGPHNLLGFLAHREGRLIEAQREFEHAVALDGADADAQANLADVRRELAGVYGTEPAAVPTAAPAAQEFGGSLDTVHAGHYGPDISARLLGRLLASGLPEPLERRLFEIPGATSFDERRFLCRFAHRFWDGRGDVFENGPLLGGTTRALALGMLSNPSRTAGALLQTFDWFYSGDGLDLHPDAFDSMITRGLITTAQKRAMDATHEFKPVFDSLHAGHDYSPLVRSHVGYLPGRRGDVPAGGEAIFEPPPDRRYSLVFVDGCKSWYGTKHWVTRIADHVEPGSHFVFQDYGWYTCFWLPTLLGVLPEHFRLVAHVDDTYAFELLRPLDAALVAERFPDQPAEFGRDAFEELFMHALIDAGARSDVHAMVSLTIQSAAALAYIGLKKEARRHISGMLGRPEFYAFRQRFIEPALRSPTYTPDGPLLL